MNLPICLSRTVVRLVLAGFLLSHPGAHADLLKPGEDAKPASDKSSISTVLTDNRHGEAVKTFTTDTAKIYLLWKADAFKVGDKLRCAWIADNVGDAAPKNTKIDEATLTIDETKASGDMTLSKPTNNFPVAAITWTFFLTTNSLSQ